MYALLIALAPQLSGLASARADAVEDFYRGKTLSMIVGYTAGGTYDIWARLVARYLPAHIPGKPNIAVQNMPGAGSLTAANYVYNVASRDGTVMGLMSTSNPFLPLLGIDRAKFDPQKVTWLGSPTVDTAVVIVWHTAPVDSFEDVKKTPVTLGSTSPNGTSSFYARIFNEILRRNSSSFTGIRAWLNPSWRWSAARCKAIRARSGAI
jgi:tripartite-type tricarboxylate transporter receptor subunit TctC